MTLLDTHQAAAYCGLSTRTLETWRLQQVGPAYYKLGRAVRYALADLNAWLTGRRCSSPSTTTSPAPGGDCHQLSNPPSIDLTGHHPGENRHGL